VIGTCFSWLREYHVGPILAANGGGDLEGEDHSLECMNQRARDPQGAIHACLIDPDVQPLPTAPGSTQDNATMVDVIPGCRER